MNMLFAWESERGLRPGDQMGFPWTREEWIEFRNAIDAYFATTTDQQIELEKEEFYNRHFNHEKQPSSPVASNPQPPKPGYIYLFHGHNTSWYKIGISKFPGSRAKTLETKAPFRIVTVAYYDVDDMKSVEAWWHQTFAHRRTNGEWFELDEYDVDLFIAQEGRPIL